jgi:hypothetical protein
VSAPSGNANAARHGAHRAKVVDPVARRLARSVVRAAPWLDAPEHEAAVAAWARAEARALAVAEWLAVYGQLDEEGNPRPASEYSLRLERLAAEQRSRLGLDPAGRARLERETSTAVLNQAEAAAELGLGRRLRLAAQDRLLPAPLPNGESG